MKETPTKLNNKERVRRMLMAGNKLTKRWLDRHLDVTNSAEILRQLRKEMTIITVWKVSSKGKRYGEYVYHRPKKVSKIKSQSYRDQSYPDWLRSL